MGWQDNRRWQHPSLPLRLRKPSRNLPLAREDPVSSPLRYRLLFPLRYSPYIVPIHP